jgi:hypothetical protein
VAGSGSLAAAVGAPAGAAASGGDATVPATTATAVSAGAAVGALVGGIAVTLLVVAWVGKRRREREDEEAMARGLRRRSTARGSFAAGGVEGLKPTHSGVALVSSRKSGAHFGGVAGAMGGADLSPLGGAELELAGFTVGGGEDIVNPMHAAAAGRAATSARGVRPSLAGDVKSDAVWARGGAAARGRGVAGGAVGPGAAGSASRLSLVSGQRLGTAAGGGFAVGGGIRSPITFAPVVMPGTLQPGGGRGGAVVAGARV